MNSQRHHPPTGCAHTTRGRVATIALVALLVLSTAGVGVGAALPAGDDSPATPPQLQPEDEDLDPEDDADADADAGVGEDGDADDEGDEDDVGGDGETAEDTIPEEDVTLADDDEDDTGADTDDEDGGSGTDGDGDAASGGGDTEAPPEGVSAEEHYDDEQLDAWQEEADEELSIDVDVRELDAETAFELFVEDDEDEEGAGGAGGTAQVGAGDGAGFDPGDNAEELAEWLDDWLTSGFVWFIDDVFNNLLGTPYPENDGWAGIMGTPVNEQYQQNYDFMIEFVLIPAITVMTIAFMVYSLFIIPVAPLTGHRIFPALLAMFAGAVIVVFGWNFATMNQMMADAATQWFLPSGEELIDIEEDDDGQADFSGDNHELRSGPTAAVLGLKIFGWNLGVVLIMFHSARHLILIFMPAVMPVLLTLMYFGPKFTKASFSLAFWQYMALTYSNIPTAFFFAMAFNVDFAFGFAGEYGELANVAMTMFLFTLGLFFPAFIHTVALAGSMSALIMKGSVASAGTSAIRSRLPAKETVQNTVARGGGYINPVARYKKRSSATAERDAQRRDVASRYGGGRSSARTGGYYTPRSRSRSRSQSSGSGSDSGTATDGGYATMRSGRTSRISPPSRRSGASPARSRHDAGSVDSRRRDRYRRLRGDN